MQIHPRRGQPRARRQSGRQPGQPECSRQRLVSARRRSTLVTERGRHLQAAARALAAGRDLLATHVGNDADGERVERSAWAAVLGAPAISRAAAAEMGALARQAAALGAGLAMATPAEWAEVSQARRDLAGACAYLRTLTGAITAAHRQEPVLAVDRAVLRAIPVATRPTRRLPGPRDPVAALCQGVIGAAERLRYSARQAAGLAWSSPEVSADSLRHSAAAAVAASHHCSVLLGTLEERAGITVGRGEDVWAGFGLAVALAEAGQAAGRARDSWQGVTRTLDQVTSDVPGQVGVEVGATRDLAVWTGRLAYADPRWTPASGPRAKARRAADLAPEPRDAAVVVAAVHHASDALARLAEVHERQARSLARAGRFLAPARSRSERDGGSRTYGVAPPERIAVVMAGYRQASEANAEAETRVAVAAETIRSPSVTLTRVRELAAGTGPERDERGGRRGAGLAADVATYEVDHVPGPVERSLQMLGVADPERIRRAVAIDRAGEQLIVEACAERGRVLSRSRNWPPRWRRSHIRGGSPMVARTRSPAESRHRSRVNVSGNLSDSQSAELLAEERRRN